MHFFFFNSLTLRPIPLKGLNPNKKYRIQELNLHGDTKTTLNESAIYTGDYLMSVGLNPDITDKRTSVLLEINEVK